MVNERNIKMKKPVISITMGDPCGIGPEIIVKVLLHPQIFAFSSPLVLGDRNSIATAVKSLNVNIAINEMETIGEEKYEPGKINLVNLSSLAEEERRYGSPTRESGKAMVTYVKEAAKMAMKEKIEAMVTAPINKKAMVEAGYSYPGHTELLAELTSARDVVMMLMGEKLKVVPVTIHHALRDIPELLTTERIVTAIQITHQSLEDYFGITGPRLAVASLNPHGGEGGLFGFEEEGVIIPAVKKSRELGIEAIGPFSPDTLFYYAARGDYDAVICMYHDQGLIPLKLLHFEDGVNITLGLPIIRTSVDHGTAYDIAGKGMANSLSLFKAIELAVTMVENKQKRRMSSRGKDREYF